MEKDCLFYDRKEFGYVCQAKLGEKIPASDSLLYTVPKGALLYLKNHTRGSDERIFEYEEGRQRYW